MFFCHGTVLEANMIFGTYILSQIVICMHAHDFDLTAQARPAAKK